MATIRARRRKDGSTGYTATVRLKRHGRIVHQESQTFSRRTAAVDWSKRREVELEDPAALQQVQAGDTSLGELIRWYVRDFGGEGQWERSKDAVLKRLQNYPIADLDALQLTRQHLIDFVRQRRAGGVQPATAGSDLTYIGVVLRAAASVRGLPVRPEVVLEARTACRELRLIGASRRRDRRPTDDELARLDDYLSRRDGRARIPMREIMWFAIHSARREAEICRIEWVDYDGKTCLLRDAKHPRAKKGNHRRFALTPEARAIIDRQPKPEHPQPGDRIFPFDAKSVSSNWTRTCKVLGIPDLRFHDLRHEATSRLFERGYQIHEVTQFTLHESWDELKRYTNLRPEGVRQL